MTAPANDQTVTPDTDEEPMRIHPNVRKAAHERLDAWMDAAEEEAAPYFKRGCMGTLGDLQLRAIVDDDGVWLSFKQAMERELA